MASASRPPNFTFTCPTVSLDLPFEAGEGAPGQTTLPFSPHGRWDLPIQTASIFLPSDVGERILVTQLYLSVFTCPTQRVLSSCRTLARTSQPDKLTFSILQPQRPTQPRCRLTARPSDHLTLPFCLNLSNSVSPDLPTDVGESLPARQTHLFYLVAPQYRTPSNATYPIGKIILAFSPPPVRLNQNFTFLSSPVRHNESWSPVGRRRGAPGQTTLPFLVPRWRRLLVRHSGYYASVGHQKKPHSQTTYRFFLGRWDWPVRLSEYWPPVEHRCRSQSPT